MDHTLRSHAEIPINRMTNAGNVHPNLKPTNTLHYFTACNISYRYNPKKSNEKFRNFEDQEGYHQSKAKSS